MKDKDTEQAVFAIIREYSQVLKNSSRRAFIVPESELPHRKKVIKNAIMVALSAVDDQDKKEQLKSAYVSLANFISDEEAKELEKIPPELFSFLEMDEDKKKEFLRDRFKSGLLGDYEQAIKITRKITGEQKRLRRDLEKY
jgi:hypothetical protein